MPLRTASLAVAAALLFAGSTAAQKDRVLLTDGTVIDGVTVTGFDLRNVEYKRRGTTESKSSDLVADLEVEKVKEHYKRAYAAAGSGTAASDFLAQAQSTDDLFLKQFGYVEAARVLLRNAEYADAFQVLEELATKCPDSGFLPTLYRAKLEYYLSGGKEKAGDAMAVAKKYSTAAQTRGFPQGYIVEAKFYETMAEAASGGLAGDRLRSQLEKLRAEAARYDDIADRCRVQIANSLLAEEKFEEARKEYEELLAEDAVSEPVRAQAWLGLGRCQFAQGSASDTDAFRKSLLSFLRVYLETPNAAPATIAEALHMGAEAAAKWGGPDAARIKWLLEHRLNRDYPGSAWAKR